MCGGDTTFSNKLSFTIISLGYSKSIVYRNKSRLNDDIYVTGNLGDSFIGLQILKGKIKVNNKVDDVAYMQVKDLSNNENEKVYKPFTGAVYNPVVVS